MKPFKSIAIQETLDSMQETKSIFLTIHSVWVQKCSFKQSTKHEDYI